MTPTSLRALAEEAVALRAIAVNGEWAVRAFGNGFSISDAESPILKTPGYPGDIDRVAFVMHAAKHYATLAAALLERIADDK